MQISKEALSGLLSGSMLSLFIYSPGRFCSDSRISMISLPVIFYRCWKWESINSYILCMFTYFWTPSRISVYSFMRFWDKKILFPRNLTMDIHFPNVRNLTILSLLGSQINTVLCGIDEWLLFRMFKLYCIYLLRTWLFELMLWTCKVIFPVIF